jgi:uncharacterized protein (TIGR03437 family)
MHQATLTIALLSALVLPGYAQTITTVAGNGSIGFSGDGGPATAASMGLPNGVTVDSAGNIYIMDALNRRVRKVDSTGKISTFAGNGLPLLSGDGGPAASAGLGLLATTTHLGIVTDGAGNVYIADYLDNRIRKVDAAGTITTFAGKGTLGQTGFSGDGGPALNAELNSPTGLALDQAGNLYIADSGNGRVRKVDTAGMITTVAGKGSGQLTGDGGPATNAQLANPTDVAVDGAGNLYIADFGNSAVRKVDTSGVIRTILHGGFGNCQPGSVAAAAADIGGAAGLALDSAGNLYIADHSSDCVHKLDTAGNVTTFAGGGPNLNADGVVATSAGLGQVSGVAVDAAGNLYLVDNNYGKIRKVGAATAPVTPPANPPSVTSALNGASFAAGQGLTSGVLASIFGAAMAPGNAQASTIPLPLSLNGVSVTVQGLAAPLLFVSPTQINFQTPWAVTFGPADIVVTVNGTPSAKFATTISGVSPGIFSTQFGAGQAIAINVDGTLAAPAGSIPGLTTHPAKPGDTIIILATGLGLVTPPATTGAASSDTLRRTILTPAVLIGGVPATVAFSGLTPQFVGVNQLNVTVPNVAAGVVPLQIDLAGVKTSDKVTIAIGQ